MKSAYVSSESQPPHSEPSRQQGILARELEDLINKLNELDAMTQGSRMEFEAEKREPEALVNDQPLSGPADPGELFREVRQFQRHVDLQIQQLLTLQRQQQAELLDAVLRSEQAVHDEIALLERRLRGDFSALTRAIVIRRGTDDIVPGAELVSEQD